MTFGLHQVTSLQKEPLDKFCKNRLLITIFHRKLISMKAQNKMWHYVRPSNSSKSSATKLVYTETFSLAAATKNLDLLFSPRHQHGAPSGKARAVPAAPEWSFRDVVPWWGTQYCGKGQHLAATGLRLS